MRTLTRREFTGSLAAAALTPPYTLRGTPPVRTVDRDQLGTTMTLLRRYPSFDLHTHPGLFPLKDIPNSANPRNYFGDAVVVQRVSRMREFHLWGGFFTLVTDAPILGGRRGKVRDYRPGEGWREYRRQVAVLQTLLAELPVARVTSTADIDTAHAQGKVAAIFACEGGDHLQGDSRHLEEMYADGVRHLQLYHVASNALVELDSNGRDIGLTGIGRDVVREMNRLGMVVDLGHASYATTKHAAEVSTDPIISSHTLVRRETDRGFGVSPDHAKVIADTGGVVGAFGGTPNRDIPGYADNILHMIDVVGVDHVGLGSDMDGTGGRSVWNTYAQLPEIVAALLAGGMSEEEVAKVIGGNCVRLLKRVIG